MSPRTTARTISFFLAVALATSCGGGSTTKATSDEPQTAQEKQSADAKAAGELDGPNAKWGKWRYTGDRKDCFFSPQPGLQCSSAMSTVIVAIEQTDAASGAAALQPTKPYFCDSTG